MQYGEFDAKKYKEEIALKLETASKLCDLANSKKCAIHLGDVSVQPERPELNLPKMNPGEELTTLLRFLNRMRKAVGAFFDNLPTQE